ncbi:hypothetical protein N7501_007225 [Penicillium viridicatum]|nr:hypothetical protein N7501_007225 [Penicillium viridicatum]
MALHCSPCARSDDARYFQLFMYAVHQRAIERVKLLDDFQTKVFGITLVMLQFIRELVTVYNWWADRQAEKAKSEGDLTKPATRVEVSQVKEDLQVVGDSLQRQLNRLWALQTHERGRSEGRDEERPRGGAAGHSRSPRGVRYRGGATRGSPMGRVTE